MRESLAIDKKEHFALDTVKIIPLLGTN